MNQSLTSFNVRLCRNVLDMVITQCPADDSTCSIHKRLIGIRFAPFLTQQHDIPQ